MSYDLVFWRDTRANRPAPAEIYRSLMDRGQAPGVDTIPIDQIIRALLATFPHAALETVAANTWITWESPNGKGAFEATWSDVHLLVNLRETDNDTANAIIDLCISRGARLYDPQTDERFDSA